MEVEIWMEKTWKLMGRKEVLFNTMGIRTETDENVIIRDNRTAVE